MTLPTIPGYTAADLQELTPDELEALRADTGDEAAAELAQIANEGEEGGESAATGADSGTPPADADPLGLNSEKADETQADSAHDATDSVADVPYKATAPEDAAAQLEALKASKLAAKATDREALQKLHDGDIDFAEYSAIKDKAEADIEAADEQTQALRDSMRKAEIAQEMAQQSLAKAWESEVKTVMATAKEQGLDYKTDAALNSEFNTLVKVFGLEASAKGMPDTNLEASKWALAQAHALMRTRHASKLVAPKQQAAKPDGAPRHELKTLGGLPNADRTLPENNEVSRFAHLQGDDLERAMATMSKADVDKLMAMV